MSRIRNRNHRTKLSAAASIVALAVASLPAAHAQAQSFDVEAGPAARALNEFARQADVSLVYAFDLVETLNTNAIDGAYEPRDALNAMLAGTGLVAMDGANGGFAIIRRDVPDGGFAVEPRSAAIAAGQAAAAASAVQAPQLRGPSGEAGEPGIVRGVVRAAGSDASLDGALVRIEETGQTTSTDDLGRFRFANVRPGRYTVTVSYLGFAEAREVVELGSGGDVTIPFELNSNIEDVIVVYGSRSARAQALNQERTAENSSTVISSDLLGEFAGATLADSLRRAPGVAFQEDVITGEGSNVIVRGLAPDLNQIRLDGQRLAEGSGRGRSASIGNLLTDSIDEVTISKTLLPSQDSNGTGGLIDITTRGPLDRERRFASFSAEYSGNENFRDTTQLSGTLSGAFGSQDNIGLSLSLQYRDTDATTIGYARDLTPFGSAAIGQYLPLSSSGFPLTSRAAIDPLLVFPFEAGVDEVYPADILSFNTDLTTETFAGTLTGQWRLADHSELRLSYTRSEQTTDFSQRTPAFSSVARYVPTPVDELGGEVRGAYIWEDAFPGLGSLVAMTHNANLIEQIDETDVLSFQGKTELNSWTLEYRLGRSEGTSVQKARTWAFRSPGPVFGFFDLSPDLIRSEATENTRNGNIVSIFPQLSGSGYQVPLLNEAGFHFFNNPANYVMAGGDRFTARQTPGENLRESASFSARYEFADSVFEYVEIGVEFERARFDSFASGSTFWFPNSVELSIADLGVTSFSADNLSAVGLDGGFLTVTDSHVRRLFEQLDVLSEGSDALFTRTVTKNSSSFADEDTFTEETELAPYIQTTANFGPFEVIGGVRLSQVDVDAKILLAPTLTLEDGSVPPDFSENFRQIVEESGSETTWLPRILANYRPSENIVVRGGYFMSVARPQITDLSDTQTVNLNLQPFFGANFDQPNLNIRKGNPDLRSQTTHNFDLSIAWYDQNAGVIQASVFYKNIQDFVETNSDATGVSLAGVLLPDDENFRNLPENIFIEVTQPVNNPEAADIWGFELIAERQFVNLPGALSGLGVFANYTYTDSEKFFIFDNVFNSVTAQFEDIEVSDVPFDQSPQHSGTFSVTYNKHGFDGSISYTMQSERLRSFEANGLSQFNDSDETLDARLEYRFQRFGPDLRVFVAGADLLRDQSDADALSYFGGEAGTPKLYSSGTFFGGRTFTVGLNAIF